MKAADCTPYIRVFSPEPESGKTRTEEVAFHLVRRGVSASSVSASAVFRLIDAEQPTLLVDEVDAIFAPRSDQEELRSLLNAGYERGNPVYRSVSVGKTWVSTPFDAFCPKMLAGIENGKLPDTIVRRSIPISLQRKRKGVAIADMAGGDWPPLARAAAKELHSDDTGSESYGVLLLADIREVLDDEERISTANLIRRLVERGDRGDWAAWWSKGVESASDAAMKSAGHQLARKLRPFGIKSHQVWIDEKNVRGFAAEDFAEAFARYLPSGSVEDARTLERSSEAQSAPEDDEPFIAPEQASSVLAFPAIGSVGGRTLGDPEDLREVLLKERLRGLSDADIASLCNAQPRSFPPPPEGFPRWTGYAVRVVMGEAKRIPSSS